MLNMKITLVTVLALLASIAVTTAAVPPMINYQGKLMQPSGVPVPDGEYKMTFAIYGQPAGSTALWSEVNEHVQIKGGLYSVLLGSVINLPANIFDSSDRFFGVKIGDDPEMTPRQQVASTAFAFRAASSQTVDDGAVTTAKIAPGAVTADRLALGVAIPPGTILMWSGAVDQVPHGWALCNGTGGTPDLRDRFIVGAGNEYLLGAIGGEKFHQLTVAEMARHAHWELASTVSGYGGGDGTVSGAGFDSGSHWAGYSTDSTGGDQPHENRPPYYALCFIMKLGY